MSLFAVLLLGGPVLGYHRASVQPGATRADILRGATIGGALAGLTLVVTFAIASRDTALIPTLLPYLLVYTVVGAMVGFSGLLARTVGKWLGGPAGIAPAGRALVSATELLPAIASVDLRGAAAAGALACRGQRRGVTREGLGSDAKGVAFRRGPHRYSPVC